MKSQAGVELAGGIPFVSDADLEAALALLALLAVVALFFTPRIPTTQPRSAPT